METLRPDRTEEGGNAQACRKVRAKNKRGRGWEGNSDLATKCNRRETGARSKQETHLDIAWSSLTCVKVG